MQFYLYHELLEWENRPVTIVDLSSQFAEMQHYSKIVLQAFSHRQESIHLYGFTHIFGYPRNKQAFLICTTSTDK